MGPGPGLGGAHLFRVQVSGCSPGTGYSPANSAEDHLAPFCTTVGLEQGGPKQSGHHTKAL